MVLMRVVVDYAHQGLMLWQVMTSSEAALEEEAAGVVKRSVVIVVVDDGYERKSGPSREEDYGTERLVGCQDRESIS